MLYTIFVPQMHIAISNNAKLISISSDGAMALINAETVITGLNVIQSYSDDSLKSLLSQDAWAQPCKNC